MKPKHPSLYRLHESGDGLELLFVRCTRCGRETFPASAYGCAHCGADRTALQPVAHPAEGTLLACVTLHAELTPAVTPPQAVGDVEIAPGVVEEVLLGTPCEALTPGQRVFGRAVSSGDEFVCMFFGEPT